MTRDAIIQALHNEVVERDQEGGLDRWEFDEVVDFVLKRHRAGQTVTVGDVVRMRVANAGQVQTGDLLIFYVPKTLQPAALLELRTLIYADVEERFGPGVHVLICADDLDVEALQRA